MDANRLAPLSAEQLQAFRRLPLRFDDMVRAIYAAGQDSIESGHAVRSNHLANRLDQFAFRMRGAGDVSKDLSEAAQLLRGES